MSLEEISFRNLVHYFKDELRRIENGEHGYKVFTLNTLRTLKKNGVTTYSYHSQSCTKKLVLTTRAKQILKEL